MRHTLAATLVGAMLAGSALLLAQAPRSIEVQLKAAQHKEEVEGDLQGAVVMYRAIVERAGRTDRGVAATALLRMADVYRKLGDTQARVAYERVTREFADQLESAASARRHLTALGVPQASQAEQVARQIPNGFEFGASATPSPDGRYVLFTDDSGNVSQRDLVTGANRRLTHTSNWGSEYSGGISVVSPDGRQVAYVWYIGDNVEVRVISTEGAQPAPKVAFRAAIREGAYKLAWMPDGRQLQAIRQLSDRTSQIGTVTIENASFRSIKSLEWRVPNTLSLSPDGRYLAYDVPATDAGSPRDIIVLATDGSQEATVVRNPANDSFPLWSPDGSHLLFLSDRTGRNSLWMVPVESGRAKGPAVSLRSDVGPIRLLGLTKSGTLHYLEAAPARPNIYLADLDALHATKPPVAITERVINQNVGSTWSRDGEYLAYYSFLQVSADTRSGVLVVRSTRTGEERTVPLPTRVSSRFQAGPKWFSDNRSVLIESGDADGPGFAFYRFAIDTGNTELLARLPRETSSYDLSPDGRTIFYVDAGGEKLLRFDVEKREGTELRNVSLLTPPQEIVSLAVSPDGMQLAATLRGGVVEVMPAAGGLLREVHRPAAPEGQTGSLRQALSWTPDGRFLLFARGDSSLWKVPVLGGREAEKVGLDMRVKTPALHPDGKRLAFVGLPAPGPNGQVQRPNVMTLENFLPKAARSPLSAAKTAP